MFPTRYEIRKTKEGSAYPLLYSRLETRDLQLEGLATCDLRLTTCDLRLD